VFINPGEIYGFDYEKEHCIRWFAPTDGKCFRVDYAKGNLFSEDNYWDHGQWERLPVNSYMELNNKQYFGSYNNDGLIHEWSEQYKTDAGKPIRCARNFALRLSGNGNQAKVNRARFELKRGVATPSITTPYMNFRYRFDGGTWSGDNLISLGKVGDYNNYQDLFALGIGRRMEIELTHTDNTDFNLLGLYLTVEQLRH
jgi:hypothetical protein